MKKFLHYIDLVEEKFMAYSLLLTVILVFMQVCLRLLDSSIPWSEELARYIFVWQCWVGVSFTERSGKHIRIEMLLNKLSPKGQKMLELVQMLLSAGIVIFLICYGSYMVAFLFRAGTTSSALRLPMYILYLSMPVSCFVYLLRVACRFYNIATGRSMTA